jgi:hypothetical protein
MSRTEREVMMGPEVTKSVDYKPRNKGLSVERRVLAFVPSSADKTNRRAALA